MVAALPCCLLPWLLSLQEKTYILQGVVEVVVVGGHDLMEACKVVMQIWMAEGQRVGGKLSELLRR